VSLTVIMHFYNEAYLLPWWLAHHRAICNHGILIDYDSTDGSADICREVAPGWEVRRSRNRDFGAAELDAEVMDIERALSGWKVILTTTEFLVSTHSLRDILACSESLGLKPRSVGLVDPVHLYNAEPDLDTPLLLQRTWGYQEGGPAAGRGRLIHPFECGHYRLGRHDWDVQSLRTDEIATVWLEFAPMTPAGRARKLQIGSRVPLRDRQLNLSIQHYRENATEASLLTQYEQRVVLSRDLRADLWYADMLTNLWEDTRCLSLV
jgi:hypothetical protein